jgi:hypothetical protein
LIVGAEAPNAHDPATAHAPDPDATTIAAVTRSPQASVLEASLSLIASAQSLEAPSLEAVMTGIGMIAAQIMDMVATVAAIAVVIGEASMSILVMRARAMEARCMRGGGGVGGR